MKAVWPDAFFVSEDSLTQACPCFVALGDDPAIHGSS
jgi:hypothetical protein